jgi:hypothetical protein
LRKGDPKLRGKKLKRAYLGDIEFGLVLDEGARAVDAPNLKRQAQ